MCFVFHVRNFPHGSQMIFFALLFRSKLDVIVHVHLVYTYIFAARKVSAGFYLETSDGCWIDWPSNLIRIKKY